TGKGRRVEGHWAIGIGAPLKQEPSIGTYRPAGWTHVIENTGALSGGGNGAVEGLSNVRGGLLVTKLLGQKEICLALCTVVNLGYIERPSQRSTEIISPVNRVYAGCVKVIAGIEYFIADKLVQIAVE